MKVVKLVVYSVEKKGTKRVVVMAAKRAAWTVA